MILELMIGGALLAGGVAGARVWVRRRQANLEDPDAPDRKDKRKRPFGGGPREGPRGLKVGDVLLYADTELWLAGMIELEEEGLVARVFITPGGGRANWVVQLDEAASDIATLTETDEVPEGRVPEALPIGGRRVSLERRGDAVVRTEGEHLPKVGKTGSYVLLSDSGGRVVFVLDFEKAPRLAFVGDRVAKQMLDVLPGGDLDPED